MTAGFVQSPTKASVKEADKVFIMDSSLSIIITSLPSSINFLAKCLPNLPIPITNNDFI